jgi:beta-N-acetylhexosaminidase
MQLADMPMAMTAHVVYSGFDKENPATTSRFMVERIIRGWLGFDGLLMSDDLSMQALSGDFAQRAKSSFAAGCDVVLHCNGVMEEMRAIVPACPELAGEAARRARHVMTWLREPDPADEASLREEFAGLAMATA